MEPIQFHNFTKRLIQTLEPDERVMALVAIGSLAHSERIDAWSDHDFWVITTTAAQSEFLANLSWLPDPGEIVLTLRPARQYYTVLYASGHIAEFAVFGPQDLAAGRLIHYHMLFDKDNCSERIEAIAARVQQEQRNSFDANANLGHLLVTLCTGAGRAARGEWLSASTYIYQYAVDDLLILITHHIPPQVTGLSDPFDPRRRFEQAYPDLSTRLAGLQSLPPLTAAQHMLDLAENLFPDVLIAVGPQALHTTRVYLQAIKQGHN